MDLSRYQPSENFEDLMSPEMSITGKLMDWYNSKTNPYYNLDKVLGPKDLSHMKNRRRLPYRTHPLVQGTGDIASISQNSAAGIEDLLKSFYLQQQADNRDLPQTDEQKGYY